MSSHPVLAKIDRSRPYFRRMITRHLNGHTTQHELELWLPVEDEHGVWLAAVTIDGLNLPDMSAMPGEDPLDALISALRFVRGLFDGNDGEFSFSVWRHGKLPSIGDHDVLPGINPLQTNLTDEIEIRARLVVTMRALIALLDKHRVTSWSEMLSRYLVGIEAKDPATIMNFAAHNRSGFAGILDLWITSGNQHAITAAEEEPVDRLLSELRSAVIQDVNRLEHLVFNVADPAGGFLCPMCGCNGDFDGAAFDVHGGVIGRGICRCCTYEPGFDDNPRASADAASTVYHSIWRYSTVWKDEGRPWRGTPQIKPLNWSADQQLAYLFAIAPYLPSHDASVPAPTLGSPCGTTATKCRSHEEH